MAGIYIHIPFCKQACTYCNFHFSTSRKGKEEMLEALSLELSMQRDYLAGAQIDTIYFGGGTPSLLSAEEILRIMDTLQRYYPIDRLREFTLEANPDDLDTTYLKSLRQTPISRLSIGVQSFRENDLRYMKRAHNAQQADYAIKAAQDAGYTNLTIDLIYGTPGLTDPDWQYNLSQVVSLEIPHFSAYALTVEEGTLLHHQIRQKKVTPVDAAQSAAQFNILADWAPDMGFEHYEISNLARPEHHAIHNTSYWQGIPYLGVGPSAHSFDGKSRKWNIANNARYTQELLRTGELLFEEEQLTPIQTLNEYIMTSLRTMWGCDLARIARDWGSDYAQKTESNSLPFLEKNWLLQQNKLLKLTTQGKLFADRIAAALFF